MSKPKIIKEQYFPYLVINGWSATGIIQWLDYGTHILIALKEENR